MPERTMFYRLAVVALIAASLATPAAPAQAVDPIHMELWRNLDSYRCNAANPPVCWKVSTLRFYVMVDLQYRHHAVRGKTALVWGDPGWTNRKHRMFCNRPSGNSCGPMMRIPLTRNHWSDIRWYTPTSTPWKFQFNYYACHNGFCGGGKSFSPPIYCVAANEQCYFDV